jgi:hypothetical protein
MSRFKVGQRVYLPELKEEAIIVEVSERGHPLQASLNGKIIPIIDRIVQKIPLIWRLISDIISLFKK